MDQQTLWHDTPEEALRALIDALGGPKKVGLIFYPEKPMEEGRRLLLKWCDPERPEKPSLEQLMLLLRMGRDGECDVFAAFLMTNAGYREPIPADPRDEEMELQRAFIKSVEDQRKIVERLQRVQVRAAS